MTNDSVSLVWRFADLTRGFHNASERDAIYLAIACGDEHEVIEALMLTLIRVKCRFPVAELENLHRWLYGFSDIEAERRLRPIVEALTPSDLESGSSESVSPQLVVAERYKPGRPTRLFTYRNVDG